MKPINTHEVRSFATKLQTVITSVSIVRSGPNFTCLMRVTHWTCLLCNIDSRFKAPPTGDRKCHVLYFGELVLVALGQVLKSSMMKSYQKFLQKSKGVANAWRFRQCTGSCCNFRMQCPICSKLHMFDGSFTLNTSALQYWPVLRAPPDGIWKCHVFTLLPLLLRDWSTLALKYMHETL